MEEKEEFEICSNTSETSLDNPASENEQLTAETLESYLLIPYGFQSKACYKPKSKSKEITGVTYNPRTRQFIILDSKGVTAWSYNSVVNSVSRLLDYPSYQFNLIRLLLYSRKFNVYFALSKDYALKVFNLNFHEVFSVVSDVNSILSMVFNSVTDELITGGTGGVKFWSFGEIKTKENSLIKDSRPMANYGLILRSEHPTMGGKWVKDIILDERNQKLYCLSERNVVAYDMRGNFLFQIKSSRPGFVTGCVYSKCSNFVVTGGTGCWVDVFSSNGGCIHSFSSHSKMVTNVLLHPETSSLIITSSQDGTVKIFSLDIMDEIYSHMVFAEGVQWMNLISSDLLYCATSTGLQVFSINHIANFWTTIRCPLKSLSLSGSRSKTQRVVAVAEDNSTRLLSRTSNLLSTLLPPPAITTVGHEKQFVRAHAYCQLYGLMYLLVDDKEIWVYYTKTNPANRVDVWQLSDVQDINEQKLGVDCNYDPRPTSRTPTSETPRPDSTAYKRPPTSPSLYSCSKIVNGVSCLSLAFLDSPIMLNTDEGESCSDITYLLVAGLQDGRLLFLNPFSASLMYLQFRATKGAVVSIKHDDVHQSLLLNTITSNQFTLQIRSLPYLELEYQVNVGNDLKCFVRMDNTILSGHEIGRLKLHHISSNTEQVMISHDETRKPSDKNFSKDHLDAVLSVDARSDLQLFCSSSKDGCIKIWDNAKVLLREIILDDSLTVVCFLNSSGDLLVGYKNHIFSISHEKAYLSSYSKNPDDGNMNGMFETASDVYEDPRIRFESEKTSHPEPIRMETYLVPFANMSIDLARYLSGHPPSSALENDETSDKDETGSELSDLFSVAPTELYMSKSGTPLSRSRSSSLVSSWDLPNLGSSPVPSPPRTPPLVMTPLIEWESESEEEGNTTTLDDLAPPAEREDEASLNWTPPKKEKQERKTTKVPPVISRRKRAGLSQVKIDSRAIRSKTTLYSDKRTENENHTSGGHEGNTRGGHEENTTDNGGLRESIQSHLVRQAPRTVIKKTKKSVLKSTRRSGKLEQNEPPNSRFVQMDPPNASESNESIKTLTKDVQEIGSEYEKAGNVVDETLTRDISRKQDEENTRGNSSGNTRVPMKLRAMKTREEEDNQVPKDVSLKQLHEGEESQETLDKIEERDFSNSKNEAAVVVNALVDELSTTTPFDSLPTNAGEQKDVFSNKMVSDETKRVVYSEAEILKQQFRKQTASFLPSNTSTTTTSLQKIEISTDRPHEQLHRGEEIPEEDSDESELAKEEFFTDEEIALCDTSTETITEEKKGKPISKKVSFHVSGNSEGERQVSSKNVAKTTPLSFHRISHKSVRRSLSPVKPCPKVVSMSDPQLAKGKSVQEIHSSSALKIYALARMHRESSSRVPPVPKPRNERRSRVRHYPSQESFSAHEMTNEELKRILETSEDVRGTLWANTEHEKRGKLRDKKDLVNWCINALRDKGQYPEFTHKPRLRSRRSMNLEKNEGKTSARAVTLRMKNPGNEHGTGGPSRVRDKVIKDRKSEKSRANPENEDWPKPEKPVIKCFSPSEMLHLKKTQVEEFCWPVSNVGSCSEGWQDRLLEKDKALKEKRLERERKILQRRRADMDVLKEKRRSVLEQHEPRGTKETTRDNLVDHSPQEDEPKKGRSWSNFENFKNNPQIFQPYRLKKFDSCTDEATSWITALQVDPESPYSTDGIFDLLPRPKSAPSIPSKCRKYMLVASESSEDVRNKPTLTPLEETLMFKRFPKSKLKPKTASPIYSGSRRPHSVSKMQTSPISCE